MTHVVYTSLTQEDCRLLLGLLCEVDVEKYVRRFWGYQPIPRNAVEDTKEKVSSLLERLRTLRNLFEEQPKGFIANQ